MTSRRARALLRGPVLTIALLVGVLPATVAQARFGDETLAKGDSGADVRSLQRYLNRAGYETDVDGVFGRHTQKRVRAFEGNEELRVDGRVTRSDARALKAAAERGEDETAPDDEPGKTQETPGAEATLGEDGLATAPADAPAQVKAVIAAGNEIAKKPYKYGGGHASERDTGYDCSGSISYALREAGLMEGAMASGGFTRFGEPGAASGSRSAPTPGTRT